MVRVKVPKVRMKEIFFLIVRINMTDGDDCKDCPICTDHFTPYIRKKVTCPYCNFETCLRCAKTYLLSTTRDPHCMNKDCTVGWNVDFICQNFYKSWYHADYQMHRRDILFHREEARMQETMDKVQLIRDAIEYSEAEIERENKLIEQLEKGRTYVIRRLREIANTLYIAGPNELHPTEKTKLKQEKKDLKTKHAQLSEEIQDAINQKENAKQLVDRAQHVVWGNDPDDEPRVRAILYEGAQNVENPDATKLERKKFVCPCPRDDCRGMLSTRYKCGVCDGWACQKCHEPKTDEEDPTHVCDESTVQTVQLLKKDSKPCPSCTSLIHRYEGCPQMWCTQCNIAFDWNTGRIDRGPVHNPHYFEYARMRNVDGPQPEQIAAMRVCGRELDAMSMQQGLSRFLQHGSQEHAHLTRLVDAIRGIHHINMVVINSLRRTIDSPPKLPYNLDYSSQHRIVPNWAFYGSHWNDRRQLPEGDQNRRLRLLYLLGIIDQDTVKKVLQLHEKNRLIASTKLQIYQMYVDSAQDVLIKLESELVSAINSLNNAKTRKEAEDLCQTTLTKIQQTDTEFESLAKYINFQLSTFAKYSTSKASLLYITDNFTYVSLSSSEFLADTPETALPPRKQDRVIFRDTLVPEGW